jgi:hypothetical protein
MFLFQESDSVLESTVLTTLGESKELNTTFCIDDKNTPVGAEMTKDKSVTKKPLEDSSNQTESPLDFKETTMVAALFPRKKKSSENSGGPVMKRKRQLLSEGQRFFPGLSD